ncbi:MAG: Gfo/Idh/MocA family oxidoreductase [Chloroflexi bacterium]|nr:Gfo/Idh/MocA family oxidoreductase [Chloroflexota bacterium]
MARVGWGIIGCGDIANKAVAPAVNEDPNSSLVAFASSSQERAEDFSTRHGAQRAYSDIEAFLADPEIDVVYAASRVYEHLPQTIASAAVGKHVLCEKPMALTDAECREMISACQQAGVNLAIAYYRRYYPKNIKIKELLASGAIGTPVLVRMVLTGNYDPTPDDPKIWRVDPAKSAGGPIADVGSHRLDLLCHWFGDPVAVAARNETLVHSYPADDADVLLIKMASGVQVTASFHWSIGVGYDTIEIFGTEGALFSTPTDGANLVLKHAAGTEEFDLPNAENKHSPLVEDFSARVLAGEPPLYSGEDGAKATRIIETSFAASRAEKWVTIE